MKKYILLVSIILGTLNAWEINTHRAFDQEALKEVPNLNKFVKNAQVENENYVDEKFEGYNRTYFDYVIDGEFNGISLKKWKQSFSDSKYQSLIEAGVILEDAQWHPYDENTPQLPIVGLNWLYEQYTLADGRYNNHFYDAQDDGNDLTFGFRVQNNALEWAKEGAGNFYTYDLAYQYMELGFSHSDVNERRRYQAKAFASVGHVMHMMNDMSSTAHTRNDSHPEGDPMEVWGRGGEDGNLPMGLRTKGGNNSSYGLGKYKADDSVPKYATFDDFIKKEAEYTSTHFFSSDTIFKSAYLPKEEDTSESDCVELSKGLEKCYITQNGTKLAIRLKSYITRAMNERFFTGSKEVIRMGDARSIAGDYTVLEENAAVLLPRAIANARNFVNYFFRGSMEAVASPCGVTVTNDSDDSLVADTSVVTFRKGGKISVYYDEGSTLEESKRIKLAEHVLKEPLAVGDKKTVPFTITKVMYDAMPEKKLTVIYTGEIGNEQAVSVSVVDISDIKPIETLQTQDGAIETTLSWTYACDINMDLSLVGNNVIQDIKDIENLGLEHAYVASESDIYPGSTFGVSATGEKREESILEETTLEDEPVNIYAVVKTPSGSKFKQYEANNFGQLNLGLFAVIDVIGKKIETIYSSSGGGGGGNYATPIYSPPWVRTYDECDDADKKHTCGCVPCEYIIHGMDGAVEYGPIGGAEVEIIRADTYGSTNPVVVYRGKTTNDSDLFKSGLVKFSQSDYAKFEEDVYYVVDAKGGSDLDRDDDLVKDATPTPNNGTIHAIIKGSDLKTVAFRVNALTEAIYQTTGDLLGSGYDSVKLDEKLAQASKKLFREKTFIFNNEIEINYHDALLWAPGIDKKKLFKPYDTFVEPIVVKTYADAPRVKESYRLIYEKLDTDVPQLKPLAVEIPHTIPNGSIIGKVSIESEGISGIDYIEFHGDANSSFSIDKEGLIKVVDNSGFIIDAIYKLDMTAVGLDAKRSISMELVVKVIEGIPLADPSATVPTLESVVLEDIIENSVGGTVVGEANFVDSSLNIVSHILSGEDNSSFVIDNTGQITVADGADIDYEKSDTYTVKVSAMNEAGNESFPVRISFKIINEIDTPLHDLVYLTRLSENVLIGTVVGEIVQLREGRSPITSFDILNPNVPFALDVNGTIRTTGYIDYETVDEYNLLAMAKTDSGNGNKVEIQILINDVYPETGKPSLQALSASIDENSNAGVEVGILNISQGASSVELVELRGTGHSNFSVDVNGTIRVASGATLDYEQKTSYTLEAIAHNRNGSSGWVSVNIVINNIEDEVPTLLSLTKNIEENATVNTVVGTLRIASSGEGNITDYTLTGTGAENFSIDENGTIRVSSSANLDYETTPSYTLQATVLSDAGESVPSTVHIYILNVPENPPVLKPLTLSIEENATLGTVVGIVEEDTNAVEAGDSPIITYVLDDNSTFSIDANGTLRVAGTLDYETQTQYVLQVGASNSAGWSSPVNINISIIDIPDVVPVLDETQCGIDENTPSGTQICNVKIVDVGDRPIYKMTLSGNGSENFDVNVTGGLSVSFTGKLDYERVKDYNLTLVATNLAGDSEEVSLDIKINNIIELTHLDDFSKKIDENLSIGAIVGRLEVSKWWERTIETYTLYGTDVFTVDSEGIIRVNTKLDFEKTKLYDFTATATTLKGESERSNVHIVMNNVMEWLSLTLQESNETSMLYGIEESIQGMKKWKEQNVLFLLSDYDYLSIVDMKKIQKPHYLSTYLIDDFAWDMNVVLEQKRVYLSDNMSFLAFDISSLSAVILLGNYESTCWASDSLTQFSQTHFLAYRGCWGDGLEVIDTTDVKNMHLAGFYPSYGYIEGMAIDRNDTYAYLGTLNEGVEIIDIQDGTSPYRIGQYLGDNYNSYSTIRVIEEEQKIYARDYLYWDIIDISTPADPKHIKFIEHQEQDIGKVGKYGVSIFDTNESVYVSMGESRSVDFNIASNIDLNLTLMVNTDNNDTILIESSDFRKDVTVISHINTEVSIPFTVIGGLGEKTQIKIELFNSDILLKKQIMVIVNN